MDGKVGWISGFANKGSTAYVVNEDGKYIVRENKAGIAYPLSALTLLIHNNNWISYQKTKAIHLTNEVTRILA